MKKNDQTRYKGECIPVDGYVPPPDNLNLKNLDPESEPFVKEEGGVYPNILGFNMPPWLFGRLKSTKQKRKKHTKKRKNKRTKQKKKKNTKRRR